MYSLPGTCTIAPLHERCITKGTPVAIRLGTKEQCRRRFMADLDWKRLFEHKIYDCTTARKLVLCVLASNPSVGPVESCNSDETILNREPDTIQKEPRLLGFNARVTCACLLLGAHHHEMISSVGFSSIYMCQSLEIIKSKAVGSLLRSNFVIDVNSSKRYPRGNPTCRIEGLRLRCLFTTNPVGYRHPELWIHCCCDAQLERSHERLESSAFARLEREAKSRRW